MRVAERPHRLYPTLYPSVHMPHCIKKKTSSTRNIDYLPKYFYNKVHFKNIKMRLHTETNLLIHIQYKTLSFHWSVVALSIPDVRSLHWQGWTFPTSALWVHSTIQTRHILVQIKPVIKARQKFFFIVRIHIFISWSCIQSSQNTIFYSKNKLPVPTSKFFFFFNGNE